MFYTNLKTRLRWLRAEWNQSGFISFAASLKRLCTILQPKLILEFGPGYSTNLFLKFTQANVLSIETDSNWYNNYRYMFDTDRLQLIHKQSGWNLKEIPLQTYDFSLIFVDGGDRVAELKYSYNLIDNDGVVFLHDAHRDDYEEGIKQYPFIYFPEKHSCILVKSQSLIQKIKKNIPYDYSCTCIYCSSESRQKYLSQFIEKT